MLVVLIETWPSQARMVLMSTPARTRWQAVVCRITCGVIVLPASSGTPSRAALDQAIDPEAGKGGSEPADEHGIIDRATEDFVCQDAFGFRPQWALTRLAALSVQGGKIVTAIPAPDLQIAHPQFSRLGDTRSGVVEKEQQRVFAAASLGPAVGHGEHGLHFRPGQPSDRERHGFLRRDGPDMAAPFDMGRIPATDEAGKCPDGGKPLIAGSGRTSALLLEMREELQHVLGCEIALPPAGPRACATCG